MEWNMPDMFACAMRKAGERYSLKLKPPIQLHLFAGSAAPVQVIFIE
jgi:hypothetical protein